MCVCARARATARVRACVCVCVCVELYIQTCASLFFLFGLRIPLSLSLSLSLSLPPSLPPSLPLSLSLSLSHWMFAVVNVYATETHLHSVSLCPLPLHRIQDCVYVCARLLFLYSVYVCARARVCVSASARVCVCVCVCPPARAQILYRARNGL